jgi:DivIVA domain-containing protein
MWVALVVAVVLVALTVAGIVGRIDGSLGPPTRTTSYVPLPEDRLTPADLDSVRLDTAFRGYRMDQVDEVIGRLGAEIRDLNLRLGPPPAPPPPTSAEPDAALPAEPDAAPPAEHPP